MDELPITHPNKVLDDESGLTKRMLAEYYLVIAGHMLPHIAGRPLSIVRCPQGSTKPCFFQKHAGAGLPEGVNTVTISSRKTGEKADYLTVNSAEGLVGLAQMGALEIHPWGSRNESLELPDRIVFDLDPDAAIDWNALAECARELHERLRQHGLQGFLKSTGGKGLHVVAPILPEHEWPAAKQFAHGIALAMEQERPDIYTTKAAKTARKGRIFLDYLRNDREATAVAPFSPRAHRGAPVAMPLSWNELDVESAPAFHVSEFADWKKRLRNDPWKAMATLQQRLPVDAFPNAAIAAREGAR